MEFFIGSTQTKERLFLNPVQDGSGFQIAGPAEFFAGGSSESEKSSTIGTPDDSDIEDEEDEVQSNFKEKTGLCSLDSLEDSLPIKRGLSSHFDGKTKSFTNLSQVSNLNELQKQESPFNKRRRVLIASKWSKKSSNFYTWSNPQSMPLLPMDESQYDEDYDYEDDGKKARKVPFTSSSSSSSSSSSLVEEKKQEYQIHVCQDRLPESYAAEMRLRLKSFKSRSFSLADLKENDDGEEDNDG